MRLRREIIQYLAQAVARDLSDKGCDQILADREKIEILLREVITDDLQVEDRLNDEVKTLLRALATNSTEVRPITIRCLPW